jgi:hypothetical protein
MDLAHLDEGSVSRLIASLKRKGVADSLIQQALAANHLVIEDCV